MLVRSYGVTPDGATVDLYALGSENGLRVQVITYGGTIVGIDVPDRNGVRDNVVLALPSLAEYLEQDAYLGALIGRFANRISGASFVLDGSEYHVSKNDGDNCLHGGRIGLNKAVWRVGDTADAPESRLTLRHFSPDGDQGFPGAVVLEVTYVVSGGNTLRIGYHAETDRPTVVNFTNHAYFNLGGRASVDILEHEVMIASFRTGRPETSQTRPSTSGSRTRSATASASGMSSSWLRLGMITISFSGRPEAASHGLPLARVNRAADAFSKCTPPNQDFSSIAAIILTGRCAAREMRSTAATRVLPLKRSISRIRRTSRPFQALCCVRASALRVRRNTASASIEERAPGKKATSELAHSPGRLTPQWQDGPPNASPRRKWSAMD
jgi:galactose mutarotase-like enzyme